MPVPDFISVLKMLYTRPFISVAQIKDLSWRILRTRVPDFGVTTSVYLLHVLFHLNI